MCLHHTDTRKPFQIHGLWLLIAFMINPHKSMKSKNQNNFDLFPCLQGTSISNDIENLKAYL